MTPSSGDFDFDYEAALAGCAAGQRDALLQLYTHEGGRLLGVVLRIVRNAAMAALPSAWNSLNRYGATASCMLMSMASRTARSPNA